jgi:hypothetical protein
MVFATSQQRTLPFDRDTTTVIGDAAHELMTSQKYRLLVGAIRQRAYKVLNDSLPMELSPTTHGTLRAYAEIYKVLTGKELFDAAP